MHIHKALPLGGGLGGGSADAAAVLRWAGYEDVAGAAHLGADVAFCLVGGRARVRGIGEVVEPLPFEPIDVTLVVPPLSVSTPARVPWRGIDLGGPRRRWCTTTSSRRRSRAFPELAAWRDRIREAARNRTDARRQRSDVVPVAAITISTLRCPMQSWFARPPIVRLDRERTAARCGGRPETRSSGSLAALALVTGTAKHLLVLLLAHSLAALLDQRTHSS